MNEEQNPNVIEEREIQNIQQNVINSELYKLKLVVEDTIQDIENNLRGIDWDSQQLKWVRCRDAQMNDKGINIIITNFVKPIINKENMQSYLAEEYINTITINFGIELDATLMENIDTFEIMNLQAASNIANWVENMIFVTLRRALNGGERKSLNMHEVREIMNQQTLQPEKSGFIGGLLRRNK